MRPSSPSRWQFGLCLLHRRQRLHRPNLHRDMPTNTDHDLARLSSLPLRLSHQLFWKREPWNCLPWGSTEIRRPSISIWILTSRRGTVVPAAATPLRHLAVTNRSEQWRTVAKANSNVCNDFRSRGNKTKRGAGDGNRTRVLSLGSRWLSPPCSVKSLVTGFLFTVIVRRFDSLALWWHQDKDPLVHESCPYI
jgi:hypothetical protein